MNQCERFRQHMNALFLRNAQHPIPILQDPQRLVLHADRLQHAPSHQRRARSMKWLPRLQTHTPIWGIFPNHLPTPPVTHLVDMRCRTSRHLGMFFQIVQLRRQLSRQPLVIRIQKSHIIARRDPQSRIPRRRRTGIHLKPRQSSRGKLPPHDLPSFIRRCIIANDQFKIPHPLFSDARQRPRNAMGAIEHRNNNTELRHDLRIFVINEQNAPQLLTRSFFYYSQAPL